MAFSIRSRTALLSVTLGCAIVLSACSPIVIAPEPRGADSPGAVDVQSPASDESQEPTSTDDTVSSFSGQSFSELSQYLSGAGLEATALDECSSLLPSFAFTTAISVTYHDALAINTVLESHPDWPFARGDDNRMTVKLRGEDPRGSASVCAWPLPSGVVQGNFDYDVLVIFSDNTFGEIGMF